GVPFTSRNLLGSDTRSAGRLSNDSPFVPTTGKRLPRSMLGNRKALRPNWRTEVLFAFRNLACLPGIPRAGQVRKALFARHTSSIYIRKGDRRRAECEERPSTWKSLLRAAGISRRLSR